MTDENKKFWWEKTIEYLFVMKHVSVEDLVVPLAGKHEVSGDAIFGRVSKWILIEFKRDESSLDSEIVKYGGKENFDEAKQSLLFESDHHFLIYGALDEGKLSLKAKGYFNSLDVAVELAVRSGKDTKTFNQYLNKLNKYKKSAEKSESGSGSRSVNYNRVIGVNDNGEVSECLTLQEYAVRYANDLELKRKAKLEQERLKALEAERADTPEPPRYTLKNR